MTLIAVKPGDDFKTGNAWARISDIAARVGIKPGQVGGATSIFATGADGQSYDVMAVVVGVLDYIDGKTLPADPPAE